MDWKNDFTRKKAFRVKKWKDERVKGWEGMLLSFDTLRPTSIPLWFAVRQCTQLSPTHLHNARPCVFLIHYLKERNVGQTKINMAPWIRPCVFVRLLRGSDCCFNRRRMELFGSAERLSLCSLSPSHSTDQQPAPLSHDLDINTLFWSGQHSAVKPDSLGVSLKLMTWDWAIGLSSHFYILYTTF